MLLQKLIKIQNELKAPKKQYNSFGKYNYRNQEDILEAAKPILYAHGITLFLTDKIVEVAETLFVEAEATISDGENSLTVRAQAGLDLNKKGMDKAQATGAASSYARKYALNGLFLIDDTKDADATNKHGKKTPVATTTTAKAELLENTEAFLKAAAAIKTGKFTIEDVKSKYVVSKEVESKLRG
jgi:hypothetical protein